MCSDAAHANQDLLCIVPRWSFAPVSPVFNFSQHFWRKETNHRQWAATTNVWTSNCQGKDECSISSLFSSSSSSLRCIWLTGVQFAEPGCSAGHSSSSSNGVSAFLRPWITRLFCSSQYKVLRVFRIRLTFMTQSDVYFIRYPFLRKYISAFLHFGFTLDLSFNAADAAVAGEDWVNFLL